MKYFKTQIAAFQHLAAITKEYVGMHFSRITKDELIGGCTRQPGDIDKDNISEYARFSIIHSYNKKFEKVWRVNFFKV